VVALDRRVCERNRRWWSKASKVSLPIGIGREWDRVKVALHRRGSGKKIAAPLDLSEMPRARFTFLSHESARHVDRLDRDDLPFSLCEKCRV
jgi:hypothetical protein